MGSDGLKRKVSYPTTVKIEHNFRREYKGSVLETKFRRPEQKESTFKSLFEWFFPKGRSVQAKEAVSSPVERVPSEILHRILGHLDERSILTCRRVCQKWSVVCEYILERRRATEERLKVSRLVFSSSKKGLEVRSISYDTQKSSLLVIPWSQVNSSADYGFSFSRLAILRLVIKDLVLTDKLVDFIRQQLACSEVSSLVHLVIHKVDFSEANSLTLHKLLAPLASKLEVLEVTSCYGMRADSLTDSHLSQLDSSRLRRLQIDGVKFAASRRTTALRIGNASLRHFSDAGAFPVLVLDRCSVTTEAVVRYTQQWLDHLDSGEGLFPPICTVRRCVFVNCREFEETCRQKGLSFRHRKGREEMRLYNVQKALGQRNSLSLQISPLEKQSDDVQKPKKDLQ